MKRRDGMTMAEVRAALRDVCKTLADIEARLIRRTPTKRAKAKSARMTPRLYEAIRAFAVENQDVTMTDIAARFNVNQGRVSEVLAGVARASEPPLLPEMPMLPIAMSTTGER